MGGSCSSSHTFLENIIISIWNDNSQQVQQNLPYEKIWLTNFDPRILMVGGEFIFPQMVSHLHVCMKA